MTTTIDTPEGVAFARVLAIRSGLAIETHTGLKNSRFSMLKLANQEMGTKHRTKQAALDDLNARLAEVGFPPTERQR